MGEFIFSKLSRCLGRIHEHVSPKYTVEERKSFGIEDEYGGITGTLRPKSIENMAAAFRGCHVIGSRFLSESLSDENLDNVNSSKDSALHLPQLAKEYWLDKDSIFCDVGSGTGFPVFCFASIDIKASVGFDIDPMQVFNSYIRYRVLQNDPNLSAALESKIYFFHGDIERMRELDEVTHVFAFVGCPNVMISLTAALARSQSIKVFCPVVPNSDALSETGLLDEIYGEEPGDRVFVLPNMTMSGGRSYKGLVIPISSRRRQNIWLRCVSRRPTKRLLFKEDSPFRPFLSALRQSGGIKALVQAEFDRMLAQTELILRPNRAVKRKMTSIASISSSKKKSKKTPSKITEEQNATMKGYSELQHERKKPTGQVPSVQIPFPNFDLSLALAVRQTELPYLMEEARESQRLSEDFRKLWKKVGILPFSMPLSIETMEIRIEFQRVRAELEGRNSVSRYIIDHSIDFQILVALEEIIQQVETLQ